MTRARLWDDDTIQFARLLCELEAAGAFTPEVMEDLSLSMDLTIAGIAQLQERADQCWETAADPAFSHALCTCDGPENKMQDCPFHGWSE